MTANPIDLVGGLTTGANVPKADLTAWAKARVPQVLANVTEIRNTVLAGQLVVIQKATGGFLYLDTTDTTTADDGVNCVISSDGLRFKPLSMAQAFAMLLLATNPMFGFDMPLNLQLSASVASNILTIAVTGNNGAAPSASNPVLIPFRDPTIANGGPIWRTVTSALSITTNAVGASLGSASTVPFRLWVVAFDNAGTTVLGLFQSVAGGSAPTAISPLNETAVASTTPISGSATAAGTFYTPNGVTLTSKSFRIIGYVDYASGLTTAATYASAPTTVQLFGPGVKKPGDVVQRKYSTTTATTTTTSSTPTATVNTISITPTAAPNLTLVRAHGSALSSSAASNCYIALRRGATPQIGVGHAYGGANNIRGPGTLEVLDAPGTTSATSYTVYLQNGDNATSISYPTNSAIFHYYRINDRRRNSGLNDANPIPTNPISSTAHVV